MRLFLAVRPEDVREAAGFRRELAHAAYRIGENSTLLCRNLLMQTRSGLFTLSDRDAPDITRPEFLAGAVLRECGRREYSGVVLDFESPPRKDLLRFAAALSQRCAAARRALYVPESYAHAAENRIVLINTAISGGNFEEYLRERIAQYQGPQHIALDLQRLCMRFSLPAPTGEGIPLSPEEFDQLFKTHRPATFFSRDLCARYFTCTQNGSASFVLFDDAGTLRQKLRLAQQSGAAAAFFQWPEIRDLAAELLRRG